ncbi:putative RNA methyltransferase [Leuconostoc gasicomitatum]|uniref:RNA methyltransferase, TrmA family n=2 Tax=Leuconostoc TaxID=1243 RepID=A0AAN2QWK0_9LACO|nr:MULTISPECIES: 23S rRNA (uracil(1939)-C(5))-methyltransferase RlmD [Leuconostoc]MBZ5947445.1 23S rRNA (uracil(1939)-C(5))-methyltransferase RlmD [Leuconostoc gasicomitatum]MBZ5956975.1 23S rRNA (uracil(1939)-C(5))-methyltransferase RlmD [Leuconostoc gasicomitatum]MBZ5958361.1 23S rRNA (uracil(1939)-C(5))-methyltransferase RlmD [Leuconostoc gasicomitatum]MBZ5960529.1 23S rRNA (uracil(1939)-C(5))-methyltransferase RlmD [Leuconostoc gasicomitatum]MBZ5965325.1 23S rRNA (uracil(1939)-C(5))-methyl
MTENSPKKRAYAQKNSNSSGKKPFYGKKFDPRKSGQRQDTHFDGVDVHVDQNFPLTIKRLGINGEGIGYFKRKIVFVPGALPDEVAVVRVTEVEPKYIAARVLKIREKSPNRVKPMDEFATEVGGFELEHMTYPAQLAFKKDVLVQSLEKFQPRGWSDYDLRDTIGMENPYEYRNKAQFPVRKIGKKLSIGMYKRGSHDLVDLPVVHTQDPITMKVLRTIRELLDKLSVSIYNEDKNHGTVKTIVVRVSHTTGEVQLTFVTNTDGFPGDTALITAINQALPEVTGIFQNFNPGRTSLVWGDETIKLWGKDYIEETVMGKTFQLSPRAFMQLNYTQMAVVYKEALLALDLTHADKLVDAYAGVGTIGLSLADKVGEVRGMEIIPEAVDDANINAKINHIENAQYEVGTAEELFPKWQSEGWLADALVVDPPRTGLDTALRREILRTKPEKFVYISCNASTLARDLVDLTKAYKVDYIQSIDMFPQTARWEGVVKLTRRD